MESKEKIEIAYCKTPLGIAKIIGNEIGIQSISILDDSDKIELETIPESLENCVTQLQEYFNNERREFELILNPKGTKFQLKVWKELLQIPFGKTTSYLQQSKNLGDIKAIRAVASANGKNPLWIVIPCHRVVGSDGSLTGYAGGLWRKKWLLNHESEHKQQSLF